ncbi:hypothetical protein V8E36_006554 [Tilletia maclaganii]
MPLPGLLGGAFDVESNAFLDIQAIFYACFDKDRGPHILYQMPEGSITQDDASSATTQAFNAGHSAPAPHESGSARGSSTAGALRNLTTTTSAPKDNNPSSSSSKIDAAQPTTATATATDTHDAASSSTKPARARRKRVTPTNEPLFDFAPIKDYIIPKRQLCGRLVACHIRGRHSNAISSSRNRKSGQQTMRSSFSSSLSTSQLSDTSKLRSESTSRYTTSDDDEEEHGKVAGKATHADRGRQPRSSPARRAVRNYRILGFPVFLSDASKYARNDFRFNMCFVFDASADTRPYEPVVRKVARILTGLEESSAFLSNEKSSQRIYGIIEQLYQDLNSYCESFVALPVAPHTSYVPRPQPTTAMGTPTVGLVSGHPTAGPFIAGGPRIAPSTPFHSTHHLASVNSTGGTAASTNATTSPSPSRISNFRGRRRGTTFDGGGLNARSQPATPLTGSGGMGSTAARNSSLGARILGRYTDATTNLSSGYSTPDTGIALGIAVGPNTPVSNTSADRFGMSASTSTDTNYTATANLIAPGCSPVPSSAQSAEPPLDESERQARRQQAEDDDKLRGWERELPNGLGRTVRDAINIKLFPIYSNPPTANDWDVPVALLDLRKRVDANWDLTMAKIFRFIDGVNHVKKIAELADADLGLTRQCMEHLLYYECIIMIDLFQFSNVYALRPLIASVAMLDSIQRECADYVIRPGKPRLPYATLLDVYARALRPGLTVSQWMEDLDVEGLHLDVRRFITFGVIKGFVRRVHRFPIYVPPPTPTGGSVGVRHDSVGTSGTDRSGKDGGRRRRQRRHQNEQQHDWENVEPWPLPMTTHPGTPQAQAELEQRYMDALYPVHPDLPDLLRQGTMSDDELCVRLGLGWHQLERMLVTLGYGAHALAAELAEKRREILIRQQAQGRAMHGHGHGQGWRAHREYSTGSAAWAAAAPHPASAAAVWAGSGSGGGSALSPRDEDSPGAGAGPGGEQGSSYTSAWGSDSYSRRTSGAPTMFGGGGRAAHQHHHRSDSQNLGAPPPPPPPRSGGGGGTRARYPSDAGYGSVSSFGGHMSGFFHPPSSSLGGGISSSPSQGRGGGGAGVWSGSWSGGGAAAMAAANAAAAAAAAAAGGGGGSRGHGETDGGAGAGGGAYDRVTGERLPANARPRSPSPVPGPDWDAVYRAARGSGHMGYVQIFLR